MFDWGRHEPAPMREAEGNVEGKVGLMWGVIGGGDLYRRTRTNCAVRIMETKKNEAKKRKEKLTG